MYFWKCARHVTENKTDSSCPHWTCSPSLGFLLLVIKSVGKREMDCSISSGSKISESVILDYKHLLLNPSVNLIHSYPMPKGGKWKSRISKSKIGSESGIRNENHGHKLVQLLHLQMRKMWERKKKSVTWPRGRAGWGGQCQVNPNLTSSLSEAASSLSAADEPLLRNLSTSSSWMLSSHASLLPTSLTPASGLSY